MKSRHDCNLSLCEKLMGHSVTIPMDNHYGTFSNEQIFEEYKKAIPELTISDEERQKVQIQNKNKKLEELEQVRLEKIQQQKQIDELNQQVEKLQPSKEAKQQEELLKFFVDNADKLQDLKKQLDNK